ncbi:hypothetical protein BDR03DRAFT_574274 [Suillus americanus]|nr:hypothetical protein BDR03DRAFT_574274 [Suillus americanus]
MNSTSRRCNLRQYQCHRSRLSSILETTLRHLNSAYIPWARTYELAIIDRHFKSDIRVITLEMNLGKGSVARPIILVYVLFLHLADIDMCAVPIWRCRRRTNGHKLRP